MPPSLTQAEQRHGTKSVADISGSPSQEEKKETAVMTWDDTIQGFLKIMADEGKRYRDSFRLVEEDTGDIVYHDGIDKEALAKRSEAERAAAAKARADARSTINAEKLVIQYARADDKQATLELVYTVVAAVITYYFVCQGYLLAFFWMGLMLTRTFIIFHDMAHGSYFSDQKRNEFWGHVLGAISLMPFPVWKVSHNFHHAIFGQEEIFDTGQTILFTKRQYERMPFPVRMLVRVMREPLVFFTIGPITKWVIIDLLRSILVGRRFMSYATLERFLGYGLHVFLALFCGAPWTYFVCCLSFGVSVGVMLFHLQHGVNKGYRASQAKGDWIKQEAALEGSTWVYVPWPLSFATLRIEYHHIHHLSTRVPCYRLKQCHDAAPEGFWVNEHKVNWVSPLMSLRAVWNVMYDEDTNSFVPFSYWPF